MRGIKLSYLPSEIGNLSELEYLDIRDNALVYIPPELAQCTKLKTFLFEGNPLFCPSQVQLLNQIRHYNSSEGMAPQFKWSSMNGQLTIMSWNLLAQSEATQRQFHKTPERYLSWEYRVEHFISVAQQLKPSLFCVQEIEEKCLANFAQRMKSIGYECAASFAKRPRNPEEPLRGVATFYLRSKLNVEKTITTCFSDLEPGPNATKMRMISNDSVFQLSLVRVQSQSFYLLNTILYPNNFDRDITLLQIEILQSHVQQFNGQAVICGSFGFKPDSKAYRLMVSSDEYEEKRKTMVNQYNSEGKSYIYYHVPIDYGSDTFTYWNEDVLETTDYIFLSKLIESRGTLITCCKEVAHDHHIYAPNNQWGSSHLPVGASIDVKSS